ncbi:MAG: hypothetical protein SF187_11805 [Deltaproteobacteria bacterium]|nr:hypothetical protein [Deltaproteobacteria bacterium]
MSAGFKSFSFAAKRRLFQRMWLLALLVAASCGDDYPPFEEAQLDRGGLELALTVAPGIAIASIAYEIDAASGARVASGSIDVNDVAATASMHISGLPAAAGYEARFSGATPDGKTKCEGKASFNISAGLTTAVTLRMDCRTASDRGGVSVVVTTNFCPRINLLVIGPTSAAFGKTISVAANVSDDDGTTPTILWTATGGRFGNTAQANTTYTCSKSGPQRLTLTVTDGACSTTMVGDVQCGSCGAADIDANGVLDCEETSVINGEFAADVAAWNLDVGGTKQFFAADGLESATSGSMLVANANIADVAGSSLAGVNQCVSIVPGANYLLMSQILIPVNQSPGFAANSVFFYGTPNCTGGVLNVFTSQAVTVTNSWTKLISRPTAPAGSQSALLRLVVGKSFRQPSLQALFDNVLLRRDQ